MTLVISPLKNSVWCPSARPPVVLSCRPHAAHDGPASRDALGPGGAERTPRGGAAAGVQGRDDDDAAGAAALGSLDLELPGMSL